MLILSTLFFADMKLTVGFIGKTTPILQQVIFRCTLHDPDT